MRIPPLYQRKGYQRFFAGIAIGFIIGWAFFLIQGGLAHERLIVKIEKQRVKINDLEKKNEILTSDDEKANKELAKKFKLHEVNARFSNQDSSKLSNLTRLHLAKAVEDDLEHLIGEDTETLAKSHSLLVQAIENKTYRLDDDDQAYEVKIDHLYLYTGVLRIYISAKISE
ncbi:sporulation membrane protein YtrI [Fictibacillus sp. JL2B1089]|uniref:sporulation membrane protein YtrI n=1 Tax=Fictibacillus sp. JL2B1089 TaxID=3399565 RepID=UPI003A88A73E